MNHTPTQSAIRKNRITVKEVKWNIGIFIIRIGYLIRGVNATSEPYTTCQSIGVYILKNGYLLRGDIPQRTWKYNHI